MRQNRWSIVPGIQAFCRGDFVYLAIPKNGLCTHTEFFQRKGWKPKHIWDLAMECNTNRVFIGHIRKPINRYIKGITQSLKNDEKITVFMKKMERDPSFLRYVLTSVNDDHTSPFTDMFPPTISPYQVNWIPMDHPKWDSNFLLNQLFREFNLPYVIEKKDIVHKSDEKPLELQKYIREKMCFPNGDIRPGWGAFERTMLGQDQLVYNHVMQQYKVRERFYEDIFVKEFPVFTPKDGFWYPPEKNDQDGNPEPKFNYRVDDRPSVLKAL
jgi:hypothetical protein